LLKAVTLLGFPLLLFAFRFFKPEEIQKTKEIFKVAPGYVRRRWRSSRILPKKTGPSTQQSQAGSEQDNTGPDGGEPEEKQ
jgi:hypothetical protein